MNLSKVLNIGFGGCGNILIDELLGMDKKYIGLFVNSAYGDFKELKHFDIDKNAFLFAGTNGTGRNQIVSLEILEDQLQNLVDVTIKYVYQSVVNIYFSLDGGTGGGAVPTFCKALKLASPNKIINLIGVIPDFNKADKISLENTIRCWNEIAKLSEKKIIDDVKFIDNSKRRTFKEVNKKAIEDIHNSYRMSGKCEYGSIDDNDAKVFNTTKGYGVILCLDKKYNSPKEAVDMSIKDTVFATPCDFDCVNIGISLKDFDVINVKELFKVNKTAYVANNNKHNTIVLGGCSEPTEIIENVKIAYDIACEKENSSNKDKRTIIDIDKETPKKNKDELKVEFTSEEFDDLFKDLF